MSYFVVDSHAITGNPPPVGQANLDLEGARAVRPIELPHRKVVVRSDDRMEAKNRTTMQPYYAQATNVAVFGRDERTGAQVWSAIHGYPGAFAYREFHRRDSNSGLHYWRITAADTDLGQKEFYDPYPAFLKSKCTQTILLTSYVNWPVTITTSQKGPGLSFQHLIQNSSGIGGLKGLHG